MAFVLGRSYDRDRIHVELGGSKEEYLPMKDGKVLFGAFRRDWNPEAPHVVLPGKGPKIEQSALALAEQRGSVPVFIKCEVNAWEFVGRYRAKSVSLNPDVIAEYAARAGRAGEVSMVLFLEPV
jgi:hypothetical protein